MQLIQLISRTVGYIQRPAGNSSNIHRPNTTKLFFSVVPWLCHLHPEVLEFLLGPWTCDHMESNGLRASDGKCPGETIHFYWLDLGGLCSLAKPTPTVLAGASGIAWPGWRVPSRNFRAWPSLPCLRHKAMTVALPRDAVAVFGAPQKREWKPASNCWKFRN